MCIQGKLMPLRVKRDRPRATRAGEQLLDVRCPTDLLARLDAWRRTRPEVLSRAQALRRLAEIGLQAEQRMPRPASKQAASKASQMAGRVIDRMGDPSASTEERQKRKRRLLKGPVEFRDMRDRPNRKA
jgi:hypothetical protein